MVTNQQISDFYDNGAVYLKGLFADWVPQIAEAIAMNMESPGPYLC